MATNIVTVTARGQVTIPKAIRQTLGIQEKEQLLFLVEGERLVLIPLRHRSMRMYRALKQR